MTPQKLAGNGMVNVPDVPVTMPTTVFCGESGSLTNRAQTQLPPPAQAAIGMVRVTTSVELLNLMTGKCRMGDDADATPSVTIDAPTATKAAANSANQRLALFVL
jgi:hypothetical protein